MRNAENFTIQTSTYINEMTQRKIIMSGGTVGKWVKCGSNYVALPFPPGKS